MKIPICCSAYVTSKARFDEFGTPNNCCWGEGGGVMKIVLDLAGFRRLGSHTGKGGAFLVILTPRSFPNTWHIIVIFTAAMLCCPNCYCCRRVDNSRRFRRCRIHDYIITEGFPPPSLFFAGCCARPTKHAAYKQLHAVVNKQAKTISATSRD